MAKQAEHRITCTLSGSDWRTICDHWEMYNAVRHYGDQDQRWRDVMPALVGYVAKRIRDASEAISVPGSWDGFAYVTQWAASFTMGTAPDLTSVMTRLAPQVSAQETRRRASTEDDE